MPAATYASGGWPTYLMTTVVSDRSYSLSYNGQTYIIVWAVAIECDR